MCLSDPSACCDVLAGAPWVLAVLSAFFLLLLLSVAGICFVRLRVLPNPPEMCLPKALVSDDPPPTSTLCVAIAKPGLPAFARVQHLLSSNSCITKTILVPRCLPSRLNHCPPRRRYWWRALASHGSQQRMGSQAVEPLVFSILCHNPLAGRALAS